MSAGARVACFGALLVAIFALAVLAGRALDPATEAAGKADHATPAAGADGRARRRAPGASGHDAARGGAGSGSGELRLVAQSRPVSFTRAAPGA